MCCEFEGAELAKSGEVALVYLMWLKRATTTSATNHSHSLASILYIRCSGEVSSFSSDHDGRQNRDGTLPVKHARTREECRTP